MALSQKSTPSVSENPWCLFGSVRQCPAELGPVVGARWCLNWSRVWAPSSRILITESWLDALLISHGFTPIIYVKLINSSHWTRGRATGTNESSTKCVVRVNIMPVLGNGILGVISVLMDQLLRHKLFDLSETFLFKMTRFYHPTLRLTVNFY